MRDESEAKSQKKEPFEYVAYWDYQPRPGRTRTEFGVVIPDDIEAVLVCAGCGYEAHKAGRLVKRVEKFPRGERRCMSCGNPCKRPVLDPFYAVRDHEREKMAESSKIANG